MSRPKRVRRHERADRYPSPAIRLAKLGQLPMWHPVWAALTPQEWRAWWV